MAKKKPRKAKASKKARKAAPKRKAARKTAPKRKATARRRPAAKRKPARGPKPAAKPIIAPAPAAAASAPPAAQPLAPKAKPKKAKKPGPPQPPELPWRKALEGEAKLGVVEDYYSHVGVIVVKLGRPLKTGDTIHVRGHTTDFTQAVESIQIEHQGVSAANPGDAVGLKVGDKCRKGDYVFLVAGAPAAGGPAAGASAS